MWRRGTNEGLHEHSPGGEGQTLLDRCISIDLEVDPGTGRIFDLAAVSHEVTVFARRGTPSGKDLDRLEEMARPFDHLIGHNILRHDLEHLIAARPRLADLSEAPIDTLWLNPLAFPRNPYHRLVKHYQDGRLQGGHVNNPERDAALVFEVLSNQIDAFRRQAADIPDAVTAFHFLCTRGDRVAGFDAIFRAVRGRPRPDARDVGRAIETLLARKSCRRALGAVLESIEAEDGWPLAYALSWILVAGGDSVMPPWVRKSFPKAASLVRSLRDTPCSDVNCDWCRETNDPARALERWFGFSAFRPEPKDPDGRPLQERIVADAMGGQSVLGILPTGTGKSICYQIPALSRFDKTGALTVVISPLVALMADQVAGMERAGIASAVTVNGMLSMPERQEALDRVRLGDASMLIISPEQLRSVSVRAVLAQREIGLWVLDEAHCVSKWGHDFRPDYRYVSRFIREEGGDTEAPILCLTATAKPDVVADIREHFRARTGRELFLLDGGASRTNLSFDIRPTAEATKLSDILDVIEAHLPPEGASGAVVYCSSRRETERVASFLEARGIAADHFHAGLTPETKADVQERFRVGELRVIAATNAFGMGIDKPDIRLVVHGDIPGSLENYLQEAGRAGRDRAAAACVLLYAEHDVERQFSLTARSRLERHEIQAILRALRQIDDSTRRSGTVVATSGEIVRAEVERDFSRDRDTDDTRVKTAVAWLEEATLVSREENRVQVFPSSLLVRDIGEAKGKLERASITHARRNELLGIVRHLMNAPKDAGITTDELCGLTGLSPRKLSGAMADLETHGLARNDMALTAFVHVGVENHSGQRLASAAAMERTLIEAMREAAPDADDEEGLPLHLAETCQVLRDRDVAGARPDRIEKIVAGMARDGRDEEGGRGNLRMRKSSRNALLVHLHRSWDALERTADLRRHAAERLLAHLTSKLDRGARGKDLQAETTVGDLLAELNGDALVRSAGVKSVVKLMERTLLWLHEQGVIRLGKGLAVFRSAITVELDPARGRSFTQANFQPLQEHYDEQTLQTHVMRAYAESGLEDAARAQRLSEDYFALDRDAFLRRWLPGRGAEVRRRTTGASWKRIVEDLGNRVQQEIVADDRERTNVLVLAGPGSGKTRVLVHRIAYLLRVRREDPRGILVLAYNRHAASEIRSRLRALVGDDANGVTVSTCHALAMRLVGASFAGAKADAPDFDAIVMEAVRLLEGEGLSKVEAEAQRDALVQGYRWILVDEYQDVGPEEYALVSAVAGRSIDDPDLKLSLFAVGDDDQNIYAFAGASVEFIRRFEADYSAKPSFLVENYRSTGHIVSASNAVISRGSNRMKDGQDIRIDRSRRDAPPGGVMERADPVAGGRVQLLDAGDDPKAHAVVAIDELMRLSRLDPDWDWARCAIIAREWKRLEAVHAYAERKGIPVERADETLPSIWRLRETQRLVSDLRIEAGELVSAADLAAMLARQTRNRWTDLLEDGIGGLAQELGHGAMPAPDVVEWLAEWCHDVRGDQQGLLLTTAHRAKGLEFDHVVILDGGWDKPSKGEDADAPRRLFYVAMTRARRTLAATTPGRHPFLEPGPSVIERAAEASDALELTIFHRPPSMEIVDLSYAGRLGDRHPAHEAIRETHVGDAVGLEQQDGRWMILDGRDRPLARMAKAWKPPAGTRLKEGRVGAVVRWRREDNDEAWRDSLRRDAWETVLPEFVFARGS